jgi:hypothetical protein
VPPGRPLCRLALVSFVALRLVVVVNYSMDIGDYMEHSGRGLYAVDPTNEAFKFGVNYIIHALTH